MQTELCQLSAQDVIMVVYQRDAEDASRLMKRWLIFFISVVFTCTAYAVNVDEVIHPVVKSLRAPAFYPQLGKVSMPVATSSDEARRHVLQGVALLNATWDFEAYRHFCEAAKKDPECLMAYWGISLAIGSGLPEFSEQWQAASKRMLDLMAQKLEGTDEFRFPKYERDHVTCASVLLTEGAAAAGVVYRQLQLRYENDVQAGLMAALLTKAGYNEFGNARPGQLKSEAMITDLLAKDKKNPSVLMTYLLIHAEMPYSDKRLEKDIQPKAEMLANVTQGFGTHLLVDAYLKWRVGQMSESEKAAENAEYFFDDYMLAQKVGLEDCEKWILARIQRAVSAVDRGDFWSGVKLAKNLTLRKIDSNRGESIGGAVFLWDGMTLASRMFMGHAKKGDFQRAIDSLPKIKTHPSYKGNEVASLFVSGLQNYANHCRLIEAGDLKAALLAEEAYRKTVEEFSRKRDASMRMHSLSEWYRAVRTLGALGFEAKGRYAMKLKGGKRTAAYNWFSSAADRQAAPSLLRCPHILYPVELRIAEYYADLGKYEDALEVLDRGLIRYPNHSDSLKRYADYLEKAGKTEEARKMRKKISKGAEKKLMVK